ncbi:MAG: hypothetical protein ACD_65C00354G0001 [uncultured bacterium]|nr:MAG: hypothetical protein ACD_65C00354G0001 [uncultured bacterium]
MIEDQIQLAIIELNKLKFELREIKKEIKEEGKLDTNEYLDLKEAYKDLRGQIKETEENWEKELLEDESYVRLLKDKEAKDEEVAKANAKLFELIGKLPQKPFKMDMKSDEGNVLIQIQPEMRIFLNGREEKRRA